MDDAESLVIEGENYQVVDECIEEENIQKTETTKSAATSMQNNTTEQIPHSMEHNSPKNTQHPPEANANMVLADSDSTEANDIQIVEEIASANASNDQYLNTEQLLDDSEVTETKEINSCPEAVNDNSIDFTADITLEQLTNQKEMTDEDVMHHLDAIENIDLDPSTFCMQDEKSYQDPAEQPAKENIAAPNTDMNMEESIKVEEEPINVKEEPINVKEEPSNSTDIVLGKEIKVVDNWYEKKLTEKVTTVKERLSKLARVLEFSYPTYKKWLELTEEIGGMPMCKLEPTLYCPLDKPYTNRWKFICSRKNVQETTKEAGNGDAAVNKNVETVWRLEPTGAWGVNVNNDSEFPPFVLRAVKTFEDFLQTTEQQESATSTESFSDDVSIDVEQKKEVTADGKQLWLWLLVRCNSMDELMLFATGKNISRHTMDRLKQVYEAGPGKDCNVKSLYCKSVNKCDDTTVTNTTFLVGSEALDEIVGGIKVQLAPKTNFWSNSAGAENVAKTVVDLLKPTSGTTVLEIGCGIGLIGLIMASKCQRVIGVDSQSEIEEAEMTCELNNIKNASFIMGSPSEVTSKIISAIKNCKTYAVINANTNIGRALDVMTCLRKINTLRRLVMVTTLTKQSVRAILELARPIDRSIGHPFIPVRACVVDTLPVGPNFEVVILMERLVVNRLTSTFIHKIMDVTPKGKGADGLHKKINDEKSNRPTKAGPINKTHMQHGKKNQLSNQTGTTKKGKFAAMKMLNPPAKMTNNSVAKGFIKFKGKRMHSPERTGGPPKKMTKNNDKTKHWRPDAPVKKKKDWTEENPQLRNNSFYGKKNMAVSKDPADLRARLSNNRIDPDIVQKVKEHQVILEIAKEKLSGSTQTIDMSTAKQLQSMLNTVLEQTNKLQNQLPRSVWDRIAPAENAGGSSQNAQGELILKDRFVQEVGNRDIIITMPNKKFVDGTEEQPEPPKQLYKRYNDVAPSASNLMPVNCPGVEPPPPQWYHQSEFRKPQNQGNNWGKEKVFEKNWNDPNSVRKTGSPMRRPPSPMRNHQSPPRGFSLKRPLLSPPRHMSSPPRRHLSPANDPSQFRPHASLMRRPVSPQRRMMSPPRQPMFQSRRQMMPQEQHEGHLTRSSSMTRGSPQDFMGNRLVSPPRRQQSPLGRQLSSQKRFTDDWNIPNCGVGEPMPWTRSAERIPEKAWRDERQLTTSGNWEQQQQQQPSGNNNRFRKLIDQDKWGTKEKGVWVGGGDTWNKPQNSRQQFGKGNMKEAWQNCENSRWPNSSNLPPNHDNWNVRGKDNFDARDDSWSDKRRWETTQTKEVWNKREKEDWNDLPEDARDPWGDDGNLELKDRLLKVDAPISSSSWMRETDKGDAWKNKGHSLGSKPQWHAVDNQNAGDKRWMLQNDTMKKVQPTSSWQSGGSSFGSWQQQSFNFPTHNDNSMPISFKDRR